MAANLVAHFFIFVLVEKTLCHYHDTLVRILWLQHTTYTILSFQGFRIDYD